MTVDQYFPIWDRLSPVEQAELKQTATDCKATKGTVLHNGTADCVGVFLVCSGQLRAYAMSDEGKEVTLYRLFERDVCLLSASCMIQSIQFDVIIEAEKDADLILIPTAVYKRLMAQSPALANYTNEIMASRFSEVMWLIEQIMWKSFDRRLAAFLLQETELDGCDSLSITHERIAAHMGTAREVVTRMLRYFQAEGMVALTRGSIDILDKERLAALAE